MSEQIENCDWLTGLWNLKWAQEKLKTLVAHSSQIALITIDVDRMSSFNCTFGHMDGDKELIRIAREIEQLCGADALVSRINRDEFWIVLNEASVETARQLAEKIRANRKPVIIRSEGKDMVMLTLSIGISHFPTHASNLESLIYASELALLKAKSDGRLSDYTPYIGGNRVMVISDFFDKFLNQPE